MTNVESIPIVDFLRARCADEERISLGAREIQEYSPGLRTIVVTGRSEGIWEWDGDAYVRGEIILYDEGGHGPEDAEHIAYWDPAKTTREVEVKRALVDKHTPEWDSDECQHCGGAEYESLHCAPPGAGRWECPSCSYQHLDGDFNTPPHGCETLRLLASVYAGHPDYQEAWAL